MIMTEKQVSRLAKKYHCSARLHGEKILISCSYKRAKVDIFEVETISRTQFKIFHQSDRNNGSGKINSGHYEPKMAFNSKNIDDVFRKISEHKQVAKMGKKMDKLNDLFKSIESGSTAYQKVYVNQHQEYSRN